MSEDGDGPQPTWDDYVRYLLLDPVATPLLILCSVIAVNLVLIFSQGGLDGVRHIIKNNELAREQQKRKDDMQFRFSRPGWRPDRPGADDDNYAK